MQTQSLWGASVILKSVKESQDIKFEKRCSQIFLLKRTFIYEKYYALSVSAGLVYGSMIPWLTPVTLCPDFHTLK